jgi:GNAT superfamily N-acetyltransferase
MAKVKVRRTNREELPGIVVLRDAVAAPLDGYPHRRHVLDLEMDVDPNLRHLMKHDPDGFFSAIERDETLGFAAAHVRSRQCVLSELWVLPQHHGKGAGEALLRRIVTYGERAGAREFLAVVPAEPAIQGLLLRHSFEPITLVYLIHIRASEGRRLGEALSSLFPGQDATAMLLSRRGPADIERIDRATRNINREVDHEYWLKERGFKVAFISQGSRVAAYAYGGVDQVGPVAGSTPEAALGALGWALNSSLDMSEGADLWLRVPAPFAPAVEALQESGGRLHATEILYARNLALAFDRCVLGASNLP